MKWFAIFKTGKYTDSQGKEREYTEEDLDKIADKYEPGKHEAPIVIGHPKTNAPAFGWIEKVKRVGDTLYAYPKQLASEFVEMVKNGLFKKRSISLYPDGTLKHVGFLGAAAPAVKGLPDVEFKDGEVAEEFESEFADTNLTEELFRKVRELEDKLYRFNELEQKLKTFEEVNQKLAETIAEKEALAAKLTELNNQISFSEFNSFLDNKIAEGKLLPKQKQLMTELAFPSSDFSEGDRLSKVKELIEANPVLIKFTERHAEEIKKDIPLSISVTEEIRKQMQDKF